MSIQRIIGVFLITAATFPLAGCLSTHHTVDASVKPIHVTLDVNLRVERELENFFGDLDRKNPLLDEGKAAEEADPVPGSPSARLAPVVNRNFFES